MINNKSVDKQVQITKASNKWKSIPKAIVVLYIFFWLTRRETRINPNILNAKVYEFIWKINEYICPKNPRKTLSVIFYDVHSQFNFFGYSFTKTIWIELFVHHSLQFNWSSQRTNRTQEINWNLQNKIRIEEILD